MILAVRNSWPLPICFSQLQFYTAMIFAFSTASRVSEYLPASRQDWSHAILSDHVLFAVDALSSDSASPLRFVPSFSCRSLPLDQVRGVLIIVREGKNDPSGVGHRYYFPRKPLAPPQRCYDVTTDLWSYASSISISPQRPFFFSPPGVPLLTHATFNERMKAIARLFSLDPARVSSHSLRAGAATQLAGAGVPDYVIKNFGNWSSDAFLGYVRASMNIYSNVHAILADSSSFSAHSTLVVGPRGSQIHVPAV
jgi:integrase